MKFNATANFLTQFRAKTSMNKSRFRAVFPGNVRRLMRKLRSSNYNAKKITIFLAIPRKNQLRRQRPLNRDVLGEGGWRSKLYVVLHEGWLEIPPHRLAVINRSPVAITPLRNIYYRLRFVFIYAAVV